MSKKVAHLKVQRWGNSLAIRIPSSIARSAHFEVGTPVEVALQEVGVAVKPIGERHLSLDERLKAFDPKKHSGEAMSSALIGEEKLK